MRRLIAWLTFLPVLAVGLWVFWFSSSMIRADFTSMRARYEVDQWVGGKPWTAPDWNRARDDIYDAIQITPDNPMLYDYMGALFTFRGDTVRFSEELSHGYYALALPYEEASLRLREHNVTTWTAYAYTLYGLGKRGPELEHALRRAMELGQFEPVVRQRLRAIILGSWATQPSDLRQWVVADYCARPPQDQKQFSQLAVSMGNPVLDAGTCAHVASR